MLNTCFYAILNMSITASVIGLLIIVIQMFLNVMQHILKKSISKKRVYLLWAIVLVRLVIPFSFSSRVSLLNIFKNFIKKVISVPITISQHEMELTWTNSIGAAKRYFPLEYKTELLKTVFSVGAVIWILGVIVIGVFTIMGYIATARRLNESVLIKKINIIKDFPALMNLNKKELKLYSSKEISTPVVFGIIKPKIVVPLRLLEAINLSNNTQRGDNNEERKLDEYNNIQKSLGYAVFHELVHIKNRDNLWRSISTLALILHWFNPFLWWFKRIADRDMELACDEGVIAMLSNHQRKEYANALLTLSVKRQSPLSIAFGKKAVKIRIISILNYENIPLIIIIVTIIVFMLLFGILVTNPFIR